MVPTMFLRIIVLIVLGINSSAAVSGWVFNNPYPANEADESIYYASFSEQPKTLDPARSYSGNEYLFIAQIYEPLLQYDYLARPYKLMPLTTITMPDVHYYDESGQEINHTDHEKIARTVYTIHLKPGVFYQPHPAFAKNRQGHFYYHHLKAGFLDEHHINQLSDFKHQGSRELTADDYIYQIKRLANPATNSPIYGLMSGYIIGFNAFSKQLPQHAASRFVDLRAFELEGVRKINQYTFEIAIQGTYPQFLFWLAMPFFAPIPWEADLFYAQPGMSDKNINFAWYPVGTGPFMLTENNPNSRMVLEKNPNYRAVYFPESGSADDIEKGYLHHIGSKLPLLEKAVFTLEKEAIPRWGKFLQGYYDLSGVVADSFDQAIQMTQAGQATLSKNLQKKGVRLNQMNDPAIYYLGFNMLDPIVGGDSERARKLRLAISIAINYEEQIAIFLNGQGHPAQGPIPPGIFGNLKGEKGMNPYVYTWKGEPVRRPISEAKKLLNDAGYKDGLDPKTMQPLILHYDVPATGGPDDKAQLNWMRKQFAQIGIALNVRATQYNRFQEKMRSGNAQLFSWGWNADYPDPENFLFLLYGPNAKVTHGGENAANYQNDRFDELFEQMKNLPNSEKRQQLIQQLLDIVRHDAPWVWGINTQSMILSQLWVAPFKTNTISNNTLKYMAIDVPLRNRLRVAWNQPVLWPVVVFFLLLGSFLIPLIIAYMQKQKQRAPRVGI